MRSLSCVAFSRSVWKLPDEVIDTLAEARTVRGQVNPAAGSWGLLHVAASFGVETMSAEHKDEMRHLAMGDDVPSDRRAELIDYCLDDVRTGLAVWNVIEPQVDIREAELRGRYLRALARIERRGIPADADLIKRLQEHKPAILDAAWLRARVEYPGVISESGHFTSAGWLEWCAREGIRWPRLPSGAPALDADTFKNMSDRFPPVRTMAYARKMRGQGRKFESPLGGDGRLRCMLSPFGSDTGRNQPSTSRYIFGASAWMRSVVMAPEGRVLAYVDFRSQEVAVAAKLSNDVALLADYQSGDPYMAFAIRAGAAPRGATRKSHPSERASYKVAALSLQYGISEQSLAQNLGVHVFEARRLVRDHKEAYPSYWSWRGAIIDEVLCGGFASTCYGWRRRAKPKDSANSIANFPVQATGAEILRIAIIALEEAGHSVVAPVHDAVLVEMDEDGWEDELTEIRRIMARAAATVTGGLEIPTDAEITFPGENFLDARGAAFWEILKPVIGRGPVSFPEFDEIREPESQI
jgi:DNA polymerase-1